jgi:hypothetical protein
MTSVNPYAATPGPDFTEQRTSVLAIIALVLGILCPIPLLGLLGAILGIIALFVISGSQGRLKGRGLAIGGIVLGLLGTMVWVGGTILTITGMQTFSKMFVTPSVKVILDIESGDLNAARAGLAKATGDRVTDEDLIKFKDAYQAELGNFKKSPGGILEMISGYSKVGPQMQGIQGGKDVFPWPAEFDNGWAVLAIQMDTSGGGAGTGANIPIVNLMIVGPSGTRHILYNPPNASGTMGGLFPDPPVDVAPADPNATEGYGQFGETVVVKGKSIRVEVGPKGEKTIVFHDGVRKAAPVDGSPVVHDGVTVIIDDADGSFTATTE